MSLSCISIQKELRVCVTAVNLCEELALVKALVKVLTSWLDEICVNNVAS